MSRIVWYAALFKPNGELNHKTVSTRPADIYRQYQDYIKFVLKCWGGEGRVVRGRCAINLKTGEVQ